MSTRTETRLERLEARIAPQRTQRAHWVIGGSYTIGEDDSAAVAEADARIAELIREGKASVGDNFVKVIIVDPPPRSEDTHVGAAAHRAPNP